MVNDFRSGVAASGHTGYTRLLTGHGSLGLLAPSRRVMMFLQVLLASAEPVSRGYRIIFVVWALLSILHAAMRIAASGLVFGLGHATLQLTNLQIGRASCRERV